VDNGHVSDADALGHGQEDVPSRGCLEASSTLAGGGAIGGCARAVKQGGGGGGAQLWRQCPPGAQHGAKSLSGRRGEAWSVQPGQSTAFRGGRPCGAGWPRSRIVLREHWGEEAVEALNSPLLSSKVLESGRVSNQAEAGQQAQLRGQAWVRLPSSVPGGIKAFRESA
jgi:hypothetical protein